MKAYRNYLGVKIYRKKDMVCGSDFKITKNDILKASKPEYEYRYVFGITSESYPHSTLKECKDSIDWVRERSKLDKVEFAEIMNE